MRIPPIPSLLYARVCVYSEVDQGVAWSKATMPNRGEKSPSFHHIIHRQKEVETDQRREFYLFRASCSCIWFAARFAIRISYGVQPKWR